MASKSSDLIKLKAPSSDESKLTTKEKIIVLKSSKLHGCVFPPWTAAPDASEFSGAWEDDTDFRLSKEQFDALDGWKRPDQAGEELVAQRSQVDLVQDVTTDCSVVASLCALTARSEKLGPQHEDIHRAIRFPIDVSSNGKYIYKLHFNGTYRKVVIDDKLPSSKAIRSLHCFDRSKPSNVCPALMEKAYLKVRGGYDFAGSNSGTDLWVLTGWIPEQLFLQRFSEDVIPRTLWNRVFNAYNYGDVLITLGTNKMSRKEERVLGLTSEHAYAVIDMKEEDGQQLFLVKNPWSKGAVWTGSVSLVDSQGISSTTDDQVSQNVPQGAFWMDLHHVINNFHTAYLNWNPGLFAYRYDTHFTWNPGNSNSSGSLSQNPQYLLQTRDSNTVYVVLTRHFRDQDTVSIESTSFEPGYISLSTYESFHRVLLRGRSMQSSHYLDAPNILLKLDLLANSDHVIVVGGQELPAEDLPFTLSAFSLKPLIAFTPAQHAYSYSIDVKGRWTSKNAGGNATSLSYSQNPQFRLNVPVPTDIALVLEATPSDLAVSIKIVWANGKRIPSFIMAKEVYGDSGEYIRGCTMMKISNVLPGTYTVVCSTFEEGQIGDFTLSLKSNVSNCQLKAIPRDEAGLLKTRLPPARLRKGVDRLLAPITVTRNSRIYCTARNPLAAGGNPSSPMKLSLEHGQGPTKITLQDSGAFASRPELRTNDIDLSTNMVVNPGPGVWLVIERIASASDIVDEEIQIEVLSNIPGVEVGPWGKESDEPIEVLRKNFSEHRLR